MSRKGPHIITSNPGQMCGDALGHLGNPAAVTSNLDGFVMGDTVSFSNAFYQNPVCVPSRCSFFTSLHLHVLGYRTISHLLYLREESLFSELRRSGYYVWTNDKNDLIAGQIPGWAEPHADEIYYSNQAKQAPRPVLDLRGEPGGKYYRSHHEGELRLDESGKSYNGDDETMDAAIGRLGSPVNERPMCVFLGFFYPHMSHQIEEPYLSSVNRKKLSPHIPSKECSGKLKIPDKIRAYQSMDSSMEEDWRELQAVYLGMYGKVDDLFGCLLRALKEISIYDNCAILSLNDHGGHTGDYDMAEECQNSFEDCLTGVPLLVRPPKGIPCRPGISPAPTELIDFYVTVMDSVDTKPSHTHPGKGLRLLLANPDLPHGSHVSCEDGRVPGGCHCDEFHEYEESGATSSPMYWSKMMVQTDDEAHGKGITIRSEHHKYINRTHGDDEFYHLGLDPMKTKNCMGDSWYEPVITELRFRILKWLQATDDIVPLQHDKRFTSEIIWARVRNQVTEEMKLLIREMIAEGKSLPETMQFRREYHENRKAKGE